MRALILGLLCVSLVTALLFVGYLLVFSKPFDILAVLAIAALVLLALATWVSLLAYDSGKRASVVNGWVLLISVAVTYLVADLLAAYVLIKPLSPPFIHDGVVHHRHAPASQSVIDNPEYWTIISINQIGLRGRDVARRKPPGSYRILMLGDSFTLGKGVEDSETFSALLERRLDAPGRHVEVLNAGVDSYSPLLSYLALREEFADLQPDLVVLNLDMSDLVQEAYYRSIAVYDDHGGISGVSARATSRSLRERARSWINNNLYFGRLFVYYADRLANDLSAASAVELAKPELLAHTLKDDRQDRTEQWDGLFDSLSRIKSLCDEHGIQFLLTVYPWGHQVNDREWVPGRYVSVPEGAEISDRSVRTVEAFARRNGIDLLNLFPAFRSRQAEGPLYFHYDMHWRPKGHEVMAEELERRIRDFLPPP